MPLTYVTGMPRSGSTLLQQILGQNPNHHVTPTSGVVELMGFIQQSWRRSQAFHSEGLDKVLPRIKTSMRDMIKGYYFDELAEGKMVTALWTLLPQAMRVTGEQRIKSRISKLQKALRFPTGFIHGRDIQSVRFLLNTGQQMKRVGVLFCRRGSTQRGCGPTCESVAHIKTSQLRPHNNR